MSRERVDRLGASLRRRIQGLPGALDVLAPPPPAPAAVAPEVSILLVCRGNICRSPMAEGLLRKKLSARALLGRVTVASAGTNVPSPGRRADGRARACMWRHGVSIRDVRARRVSVADFDAFDLMLAMDERNRDALLALARGDADGDRVRLLLDDSDGGDIPDPAELGPADFRRTYEAIDRATDAVVARLVTRLEPMRPAHVR